MDDRELPALTHSLVAAANTAVIETQSSDSDRVAVKWDAELVVRSVTN